MDVSNLIRDPGRVFAALTRLPDGSVIANRPLKMCFPKRFEENNFATITDEVVAVGMMGIIVDNHYASLAVLLRYTFLPGEIEEVIMAGERYIMMSFEAGETVIERLKVATETMLGYYYYMEFGKFANIPWYLDFEIVNAVLDEAKVCTGKAISEANQAMRVMYSLTCREPNNPEVAFRYSPAINIPNAVPLVIGVNNPGQLLTGVFARYSGGYITENTTAALLEDDTPMSDVEKIFKGIPDD